MSDFKREAVAWQYRVVTIPDSNWCNCTEDDHDAYALFPDRYEVRELIPATTLTDMQRRLEELADAIDRVGVLASGEKTANAIRLVLRGDGKGEGEANG